MSPLKVSAHAWVFWFALWLGFSVLLFADVLSDLESLTFLSGHP
jgi:hypothetical protein